MMAEIDTSLYKGNMTPQNPLDQASKALGVAQQAQGLDTSRFELALKQLGALRTITSSFLSDPDAGKTDITKRVQDEVSKLAALGVYSPQQAVQFLKGFPSKPNEQYRALVRIHAQALSASEMLQAVVGSPQDVDAGPGTLTRQTPIYPGLPMRERGFVRSGLPPTATVPNRETLQPEYLGTDEPPVVEQRPGSLRQTPAAAPSRPGSIAPVQSPRATPSSMAPPAFVQSGTPSSGRIPAAMPMGAPEAASASGAELARAREAAGGYQERVNPTRSAIEILSKMDTKDVGAIGPGSEQFNKLKSAAITWGLGEIAGVDPNKVADFNKLRKYFEDAASRRAAGLGPKTNDGLASALTASPNAKLDRLSALELSKVNLALDRMQQAAVLEFDSQRPAIPEGRYATWRAQWASKQDPRAFIYDLMTPEAQRKLLSGMDKKQRERFEASLELADKHNLLGDVNDGK